MGTRERRQREVAEREQRFLDAARELIQQDGLLNLQMSRIAEKCDYAVGTLYQHFVSKEDLLVALASEEAQERVDMFVRVHRWAASTRSEEHTSELQSLMRSSYAVFCLKKKKQTTQILKIRIQKKESK